MDPFWYFSRNPWTEDQPIMTSTIHIATTNVSRSWRWAGCAVYL